MALVARLAQAEIRSQEFYPHIPNEWQGPTYLVHLPLLYQAGSRELVVSETARAGKTPQWEAGITHGGFLDYAVSLALVFLPKSKGNSNLFVF